MQVHGISRNDPTGVRLQGYLLTSHSGELKILASGSYTLAVLACSSNWAFPVLVGSSVGKRGDAVQSLASNGHLQNGWPTTITMLIRFKELM